MEVLQLIERRWKYFKDIDNYFQLALFSSTLIFIYGFDNHYWCSNIWQWQIGAVAVFLSWLNFIFILKYTPYVIAGPINMFLSICGTFLRLVYLPFVLISAFGVPFYMVFVRTNVRKVWAIHLHCSMTFILNCIFVCVCTSVLANICNVCSFCPIKASIYTVLFYLSTERGKSSCISVSSSRYSKDLTAASWGV